MRTIQALAVIAVAVGLLVAACDDDSGTNSPLGTPELTILENEFDFGIAPQNSTISHDFWLHSTGTADVKITRIVPG